MFSTLASLPFYFISQSPVDFLIISKIQKFAVFSLSLYVFGREGIVEEILVHLTHSETMKIDNHAGVNI